MSKPVIIDLPMPPSTNRIWANRKGGGKRRSERYATWRNAAGWSINTIPPAGRRPIVGHFTAVITLDATKRRGDADNRIKAVLDLLQEHGIIANDALCDRVSVSWGYAPSGCRVAVYPATETRRQFSMLEDARGDYLPSPNRPEEHRWASEGPVDVSCLDTVTGRTA